MRRAGHSFGGVVPFVRVFNYVCVLETSTNSHYSPQFGCSTTESNINFTYRHSNCSRVLLPAPRQCGCFSHMNPFIGHISESAVRVASNHILKGIPDRRDSLKHCILQLCSAQFDKNKILRTPYSRIHNIQGVSKTRGQN